MGAPGYRGELRLSSGPSFAKVFVRVMRLGKQRDDRVEIVAGCNLDYVGRCVVWLLPGRSMADGSHHGQWRPRWCWVRVGIFFLDLDTLVRFPGPGQRSRRWVDVFWIASRSARNFDPKSIRYVYFSALAVYAVLGIIMLSLEQPVTLLFIATLIMNFALGFSCLHTLAVNLLLLPVPLRPGWMSRMGLLLAGLFFLAVALLSTVTTLHQKGII